MSLKNASLDQVRINICNNQTYTMTAALALTTLGNGVLQGFASSVGDLGKATFSTNLNSASNFTWSGAVNATFIDLIFVCTAVTNANHLVLSTATVDSVWIRCVFHGARGLGFGQVASAGTIYAIECEAYDCNKSNTANTGAFVTSNTVQGCGMYCYNCYSHDNTSGTGAHGWSVTNNGNLILVNCIADTNAGSGVLLAATSGGLMCMNCNFYNNTGDGITISHTAANVWPVLINNNFLLNAGKGVNVTTASQGGILYNNGRGAGTQANGGVDVLSCVVDTSTDITYASNVTPWNAPTTGDFRTILAAAKGVGRGVFTETDGTNTGTIGYPDIGAAQAIIPAPSGGLRLAGSGGLAA